jgi:chemotaxis protein MotB
MKNRWIMAVMAIALAIAITGCSSKNWEEQVAVLEARVDSLSTELEQEKARTAQLNDELARALSEYRAKEQVWMEQKEDLTQITIDGEVTFASGSARIRDEGQEIISRIWEVLRNYPERDIHIEGHTDDVQIAPKWQHRFKSNWELSSARAHAVLHYAVENFGVDPTRIAAVGYGEFRPIATNETPEGRSMNRRVVITVSPRKGAAKGALP